MKEPWYKLPETNFTQKSAIIIGGGLAGTSAAYSLLKRGWKVTLIERNSSLANGASGNPIGIVAPLITHKNDPIGEFYLAGFQHSLAQFTELNIWFNNCGVIELGKNKIHKNTSDIIIPDKDIKNISANEASNLSGIKINSDALYLEKSGFVNPPEICNANVASKNIEVIYSQNILSLAKTDNGWSAIDSLGNEIARAAVVIITNASDAKTFSQCNFIPLHPVRGQLTYLPAQNLGLKKILCYDGGYIAPEINGFHCVGATYSRISISAEISIEDHYENVENLRKIIDISDVDYKQLDGRVSFRAGVPDRRPVIGAVPDVNAFNEDYADLKHGRKKEYPAGKYLKGLYVSTGHGSRGLTSCPIGGEIIAAMINNEKLPVSENIINSLNPARFIIKELKRF